MKNSITERIANFLAAYPPFSKLSFDDLIEISSTIRVVNLDKNKFLFQINDDLHDCFYVVSTGMINLSIISDAEETLINHCVPGDIFGLRPFFAKNNYMINAKAQEDTVVFAIPINTFKGFVANNPEVLDYLLQSFATTGGNTSDKGKLIRDTVQLNNTQTEIQFFQSLDYNRTPLLISEFDVVQNVAIAMSNNLTGCAIVHLNSLPIGMITDVDLRTKIATGKFYITTLAKSIMNTAFVVVPENISLAEAQITMINENVTFLCVTEDGTTKTKIEGIISQHDLISSQANNPGVLVKKINKALTANELKILKAKLLDFIKNSIDKKIPISHINNIVGEVNSSIIKRAYNLAILEYGSPPSRFSVLNIGSQGRKEQLLTTDLDSILVFEDVPNDKYRETKEYFLKISEKANDILLEVDFLNCENGHTSSNTIWCKSLTEWTNQYANWINTPGEKTNDISGIFFDFDFAFGNKEIEETLEDFIFNILPKKKKFFAYLGSETIKNPAPLSFFKQFHVEEEGKNKDLFDIKTRALNYFVDAARVLILSHNIKGIKSTSLRFKQLAITEPKNATVYLEASETFLNLLKIRAIEGIKNNNSGQFLNLEEMSKPDKDKLKHYFGVIKDLEEIIKSKFQLTYFS